MVTRDLPSGEVGDEALMLRYQRGDRGAFANLVRRHQLAVYNFVLRQLGSALAADEVAREVFLAVVRQAPHFDYETPFVTRLFAIACQLVREQRAQLPKRTRENAGNGSGRPAADTLEDSIVRAVDELPDEQKDVFLLREIADLPFCEIATVTCQPETTVKVQMQQALQRLRAALQDFDEYRRALR
jgi:RNA polymerase sigma-70 factor (ECF subfamily)